MFSFYCSAAEFLTLIGQITFINFLEVVSTVITHTGIWTTPHVNIKNKKCNCFSVRCLISIFADNVSSDGAVCIL